MRREESCQEQVTFHSLSNRFRNRTSPGYCPTLAKLARGLQIQLQHARGQRARLEAIHSFTSFEHTVSQVSTITQLYLIKLMGKLRLERHHSVIRSFRKSKVPDQLVRSYFLYEKNVGHLRVPSDPLFRQFYRNFVSYMLLLHMITFEQLNKIQTDQNTGLRTIIGCHFMSPNEHLNSKTRKFLNKKHNAFYTKQFPLRNYPGKSAACSGTAY